MLSYIKYKIKGIIIGLDLELLLIKETMEMLKILGQELRQLQVGPLENIS